MERQEKINRFLKKEMSSEELTQFVWEMDQDQLLKAEVEETRIALRLLRTAAVQQVAQRSLKSKFAETQPGSLYRRRGRMIAYWSGFAAAAAFVLYFSFSPVFLPPVEDDLLVVRSEEEVNPESESVSVYQMLLEGQRAQKEGNYLGAIHKLDRVLGAEDLRDYYRQAAQWNLALAYLESGQAKKANQVLTKLNNEDVYEYPVSFTDRWKIYLRVKAASFW